MPASGSQSKTLCCLCCASGPIEVEFHGDRSGYVPGEHIKINATLSNSSNSEVHGTSVHLMQEVIYYVTTKTKTEIKPVATVEGEPCGKHKTITWDNVLLRIPPLPPSHLTHCRIIDINYYIMFEGHMRTFAINLRKKVPIIIGTIPLHNLEVNLSTIPSVPSDMTDIPPSGQVPSPTYAKVEGETFAIKDEEDSDHTMGDTTYSPQYTYFDWK